MRTTQTLLQDNIDVLRQGLTLIAGLEPELYAKPEPGLGISRIGSHVRHVVDFYERLFEGLETGRLDYDARRRDPRVETDAAVAVEQIEALVERLAATVSPDHRALETKQDSRDAWTASSVERELAFVLSHTVHHYALIAVVLRANGVEPGEKFGVAPSTLRHWAEQRTGERTCAR
ncbi:MAG: DinB family protein [bacterium]|nr:DinB family protein [bacterium]